MILHLFSEDKQEFLVSGEYPENRTPNGVLVYKGDLPECKESEKLVLVEGKVVVMNPVEWTKHRIKIGDLEISESEKIGEDGKLVPKTELEILEEGSPENAFRYIYQKISSDAANQIVSGYSSLALGSPHTYDTGLEDQFNFKSIKDMNIDAPLRCINETTKVKTFVHHTKEQVKEVHDGFVQFKSSILIRADEDKKVLRSLFESGKSSREILSLYKS